MGCLVSSDADDHNAESENDFVDKIEAIRTISKRHKVCRFEPGITTQNVNPGADYSLRRQKQCLSSAMALQSSDI